MGLSRKRQKELRQLQNEAAKLWSAQQVVAADAANVAREAGRQLDNFRREQVVPAVQDVYENRVVPTVDKGIRFSRDVVDHKVIPAVGGVIGSALTAWDIANAKRGGTAHSPRAVVTVAPAEKSGPGIGSVIAIVLGIAAAVGVVVAAWQALRADDELWVADDPLNAPEA